MSNQTLEALYADAIADIESGEAAQRPCGLDDCWMQGGCAKCLSGVLRSSQPLDVAQIDVFEDARIVRLTMTESCKGKSKPCVVFFKTRVRVHSEKHDR